MTDVASLLAKTELFGGLDAEARRQVADQMRSVNYAAGQLIFERGDVGREIYLVISGRVRTSVLTPDGRELSFASPRPGQIFGEIAALDGGIRTAHATAVSKTTLMALSQPAFDRLMTAHPSLARAAIHYLCRLVRTTNEQIESVALYRVEVRLARFLLALVKQQHGASPGPRASVSFDLSQSELGLQLGASRPKVNAALMALEQEGAIERQGAAIICNMNALLAVSEH